MFWNREWEKRFQEISEDSKTDSEDICFRKKNRLRPVLIGKLNPVSSGFQTNK